MKILSMLFVVLVASSCKQNDWLGKRKTSYG